MNLLGEQGARTATHSTPPLRLMNNEAFAWMCPCGLTVIGIQHREQMFIKNLTDTDDYFKNESLNFFKLKA